MKVTTTRVLVLVAAAALLGAACNNGEPTAEPEVEAPPVEEDGDADELVVIAVDTRFQQSELRVPAGEEVTVEFRNQSNLPHTFTSTDADFDTGSVSGGEDATVTFTVPDEPAEFFCSIHPTMTGTITPEE